MGETRSLRTHAHDSTRLIRLWLLRSLAFISPSHLYDAQTPLRSPSRLCLLQNRIRCVSLYILTCDLGFSELKNARFSSDFFGFGDRIRLSSSLVSVF